MMIRNLAIFGFCLLLTSSFVVNNENTSEESMLHKLEYQALKGPVGKVYTKDIAQREDCNKSRVQYLGIVHTVNGKSYKILTSFFVFRAASTCHGASKIKIYDLKNRFTGQYRVDMPDALPDVLKDNQLLFSHNSKDCDQRTKALIDLHKGLPRQFFLGCSNKGGDMCEFSGEE